jgi:hypothetical protein
MSALTFSPQCACPTLLSNKNERTHFLNVPAFPAFRGSLPQ